MNIITSAFLAARPKTLTASLIPVWAGCMVVQKLTGSWNASLALLTLTSCLCLQIACNFFNDAIDHAKHADTERRTGPVRMTASGALSHRTVMLIGLFFLLGACLLAFPLIELRGWPILAIGIPSLYFTYGYTGGPWPLAYKGLGEIFVILFFGLVAVLGTILVQIGTAPVVPGTLVESLAVYNAGIVTGIQCGLLCAVMISVNNIRDRKEDLTTGKHTLAVRLGEGKARAMAQSFILDAVRREQEKIEALKLESERAKRMGDLTRASEITYGELPEAQRALTEGKEKLSKMQKEDGGLLKEEVTEGDIAKVVATWTGIPAARLQEGERAKLVHMEERLGARVIGQKQAVKAVSDAVRRARAGLQDENRPIGSFLFLGPTGVGKTELSKALAEFLFDSENAIVRIDMSEYMEKHSVARLIGAPPGYVGYEEGGQLSEAVRRRPYCVVLFDEIEKAHPDVFNVLLQVLDDGRITDGQGRTVDFRNTVIIMTSNIGSQYILNEANAEQREAKALEALRGHFRPEFLNRIDEIIIFDRLTAQELKGIVDIQLQRVRRRLEAKGLFLRMTPEATALVADHGFDPVYGARPLKRAIQHDLLDPLSLKLLEGDFPEGTEIVVREKDGKLDFTKEKR